MSDGAVEDSRLDHVFVDTGLFDVTMIITDVHKCKDTFTINNMFHIYDLNTDFKISNNYGCDSLFVNLQLSSDYPLSNVIWDFETEVIPHLLILQLYISRRHV